MAEETTHPQTQSNVQDTSTADRAIRAETVLGFSVIGCMVAGVIAIFKATESSGYNSAACVLASVAAFATVCYIYFRRN